MTSPPDQKDFLYMVMPIKLTESDLPSEEDAGEEEDFPTE